jgi:hypothetical protein
MNVSQFVQSVVGYFVKYVLPHVPEEKRFWLNIGARLQIEGKMAEIIPMLKDAKVIDENGNVDVDKLQKFAEEAFKDTPRAFVGKFEFASSDLPQFINYLKTGV